MRRLQLEPFITRAVSGFSWPMQLKNCKQWNVTTANCQIQALFIVKTRLYCFCPCDIMGWEHHTFSWRSWWHLCIVIITKESGLNRCAFDLARIRPHDLDVQNAWKLLVDLSDSSFHLRLTNKINSDFYFRVAILSFSLTPSTTPSVAFISKLSHHIISLSPWKTLYYIIVPSFLGKLV